MVKVPLKGLGFRVKLGVCRESRGYRGILTGIDADKAKKL